ncbi:MAG: hypothetical protein CFH10_01483 [Alphaproteobacteria bacterium MarineAlpha4_Bin2]|nr:MAG: hypothetical protein CFH10_01483 [Alphaproteobacteria bacterium MarineAlpha4_Bin2]
MTGAVGCIVQPGSGPVEIPIVPGTLFDLELLSLAIGEHGRAILRE